LSEENEKKKGKRLAGARHSLVADNLKDGEQKAGIRTARRKSVVAANLDDNEKAQQQETNKQEGD
jgi:hypothetical protein